MKLVHGFLKNLLHPADAEVVTPTGDAELDEMRGSSYGGDNLAEFALPEPTFVAFTSLPVETRRATPANLGEAFFASAGRHPR